MVNRDLAENCRIEPCHGARGGVTQPIKRVGGIQGLRMCLRILTAQEHVKKSKLLIFLRLTLVSPHDWGVGGWVCVSIIPDTEVEDLYDAFRD